ncbi:CRISPR-associated endoribonuclease Cas6 [Coprobacillus sp. AM29-13]|nr:CRISPR-associated endoribonuclease Cas6 [Coprobacillus sp. AF17-17AC]RGG82478.1 CRISPR-associated endoribonuclease Cas6 [Coprobacillus sp. AF17-11AC]RHR18731.1 CRISPR-associated endoribonuclease Cas6 [Coprobacillus sp. AF19-3]RHT53104.1 CRISPR-associated endoribonuclease Cas6 [Coprobacillus sp. AM29-13]
MRLKITIETKNKFIPFEYHGFLQGVIYHSLDKEQGNFFHDEGFGEQRIYKMFVFSELSGHYHVVKGGLMFDETASFYVSSVSSKLLNTLYEKVHQEGFIYLGKTKFKVVEAIPVKDVIYHEDHVYYLTTISPIVCYKTDAKKFMTFFHPKSQDFELSLQENLRRKYLTLFEDDTNELFEIQEIIKYRNTKVKYKKMVYNAYNCTMKVKVSPGYLKLLMHVGLGSKNAAGFGMVRIL